MKRLHGRVLLFAISSAGKYDDSQRLEITQISIFTPVPLNSSKISPDPSGFPYPQVSLLESWSDPPFPIFLAAPNSFRGISSALSIEVRPDMCPTAAFLPCIINAWQSCDVNSIHNHHIMPFTPLLYGLIKQAYRTTRTCWGITFIGRGSNELLPTHCVWNRSLLLVVHNKPNDIQLYLGYSASPTAWQIKCFNVSFTRAPVGAKQSIRRWDPTKLEKFK